MEIIHLRKKFLEVIIIYKQPQIIAPDEEAYARLKEFCQVFEELTIHMRFEVQETYFDYGQDWQWTTIIAYDENGSTFQALYPASWSEICNGLSRPAQISLAKRIISEYPSIWTVRKDPFKDDK